MFKDGKIVKASIKDIKNIAALIKAGWNSAYIGLIPDEYLKNMNEEELVKRWKANIEKKQDIYVYEINNKLMGVVKFGKTENLSEENMGEIMVLYVQPKSKRNGIGTYLFRFAQNKLKKKKYKKMIVWCLKGNIEGTNFYKKMGGKYIGDRDFEIRGLKIKEEGFFYNLIKEGE